jgi:hypothetical protein
MSPVKKSPGMPAQFDPEIARAFLNVGLRRTQWKTGFLAWLSSWSGVHGSSAATVVDAGSRFAAPSTDETAAISIPVGFGQRGSRNGPDVVTNVDPDQSPGPEGWPNPDNNQSAGASPQYGSIAVGGDTAQSDGSMGAGDSGSETVSPDESSRPGPDSVDSRYRPAEPTGPVATAPRIELYEDTSGSSIVISSVAGSLTVSRAPGRGEASIQAISDRSWRVDYVPVTNHAGYDSFAVTACDGAGKCTTKMVTTQIYEINDVLVAMDRSVMTNEDTVVAVQLPVNDIDGATITVTVSPVTDAPVLAADVVASFADEAIKASSLTFSPLTPGGFWTVESGKVRFTPPLGATATFRATYGVCDVTGLCGSSSVKVMVTHPA